MRDRQCPERREPDERHQKRGALLLGTKMEEDEEGEAYEQEEEDDDVDEIADAEIVD